MKNPRLHEMERARAARAILVDTKDHRRGGKDEGAEMAAFMAIFHPEFSARHTAAIVRDAKAKR